MSNPVIRRFDEQERVLEGEPMTINGTIQITVFLTLLVFVSAAFVWSRYSLGYLDLAIMLTSAGGIVGFITGLIVCFTRTKYLIPVYAVAEGLFLGGISAVMEASYPGIVSQAVAGTFAALFSMLILYKLGVIKCTDKFRSVIFISTCSVLAVYLVDFIGRLFGYAIPLINTSSNVGIFSSIIVIAIAALNFIIDFDFIEKGAQRLLPKDYEWYGAFGLMVTLIWLYIEILKLLLKLDERR